LHDRSHGKDCSMYVALVLLKTFHEFIKTVIILGILSVNRVR
jgi:hypothetical protein